MIGLKVVMGDPGKHPDPFAAVGALYRQDIDKIQFKLAKQFLNKPYGVVANYFIKVHKTIKPNFMGIETNNKGTRILKLFREKYKMEWMHGVHTSGAMTEEARQKGFSMDKPFMVNWVRDKQKDHFFEFPSMPTKDMQELIDQWPKIVAVRTANGSTTYKAFRGQHDDLFMSALLCCNFIRLYIEQQDRLK